MLKGEICPNCNKLIGPQDSHCPSCGGPRKYDVKQTEKNDSLKTNEAAPEGKKEKSRLDPTRIALCGIFIFVVVMLVLNVYLKYHLGRDIASVAPYILIIILFSVVCFINKRGLCPYCGSEITYKRGTSGLDCKKCKNRIIAKDGVLMKAPSNQADE